MRSSAAPRSTELLKIQGMGSQSISLNLTYKIFFQGLRCLSICPLNIFLWYTGSCWGILQTFRQQTSCSPPRSCGDAEKLHARYKEFPNILWFEPIFFKQLLWRTCCRFFGRLSGIPSQCILFLENYSQFISSGTNGEIYRYSLDYMCHQHGEQF